MMTATAHLNDRRVFFLGVNTGFVTDGLPDERFVDFYKQRSSVDLHCAIIGNIVVPGGYGSNESTPMLSGDRSWERVATAIRTSGSLPGIQLASAWPGYRGQRKFVVQCPSQRIQQARKLVQSLGADFINQMLDAFFKGAALAVDHGFRHVQVHAAHGYLPNLLVDDRINPSASQIRERLAELALWLASQKIESSIRCTIRTGDAEFDKHCSEPKLGAIVNLPFDFVDLSSGFYNIDKRLIYPSRPDILTERHEESRAIVSHHPDRRFIVSGKVMNEIAKFPNNASVGICRDLIANPRFLTDHTEGCRNHGKCHYYSRGEAHVTCPKWARLPKE